MNRAKAAKHWFYSKPAPHLFGARRNLECGDKSRAVRGSRHRFSGLSAPKRRRAEYRLPPHSKSVRQTCGASVSESTKADIARLSAYAHAQAGIPTQKPRSSTNEHDLFLFVKEISGLLLPSQSASECVGAGNTSSSTARRSASLGTPPISSTFTSSFSAASG